MVRNLCWTFHYWVKLFYFVIMYQHIQLQLELQNVSVVTLWSDRNIWLVFDCKECMNVLLMFYCSVIHFPFTCILDNCFDTRSWENTRSNWISCHQRGWSISCKYLRHSRMYLKQSAFQTASFYSIVCACLLAEGFDTNNSSFAPTVLRRTWERWTHCRSHNADGTNCLPFSTPWNTWASF